MCVCVWGGSEGVKRLHLPSDHASRQTRGDGCGGGVCLLFRGRGGKKKKKKRKR